MNLLHPFYPEESRSTASQLHVTHVTIVGVLRTPQQYTLVVKPSTFTQAKFLSAERLCITFLLRSSSWMIHVPSHLLSLFSKKTGNHEVGSWCPVKIYRVCIVFKPNKAWYFNPACMIFAKAIESQASKRKLMCCIWIERLSNTATGLSVRARNPTQRWMRVCRASRSADVAYFRFSFHFLTFYHCHSLHITSLKICLDFLIKYWNWLNVIIATWLTAFFVRRFSNPAFPWVEM